MGVSFDRKLLTGEAPTERQIEHAYLSPGERQPVSVYFDPSREGEYCLHVRMMPGQEDAPKIDFKTPTLLTVEGAGDLTEIIPPSNLITSRTRVWPFQYRYCSDFRSGSQPAALTFEMQFSKTAASRTDPADNAADVWVGGRSPLEARGEHGDCYLLSPPQFLPPLGELSFGPVQFRIRVGEEVRHTWPHDNVMPHEPVLSGLRFFVNRGDEDDHKLATAEHLAELAAGESLSAEVEYRPAPELAQWEREKTTFYVVPDPHRQFVGGLLSVKDLHKLLSDDGLKRIEVPGKGAMVRHDLADVPDHPRRIFRPYRAGGERYVVVAAATYMDRSGLVNDPDDSQSRRSIRGPDGPAEDPAEENSVRRIEEWSDAYVLEVPRGWVLPYALPGYALAILWSIVVQFLRWLVTPKFEELRPVDLYEQNNDVELAPNIGVPGSARVGESGFWHECGIYGSRYWGVVAGYLASRRGARLVRYLIRAVSPILMPLLKGLVPLVVTFFRRALVPNRWGWVLVKPYTSDDTLPDTVRTTDYVCVKVSILNRRVYRVRSGKDSEVLPVDKPDFETSVLVTVGPGSTYALEVRLAPEEDEELPPEADE